MLRKFCICLGVYYQLWLVVTDSDVEEADRREPTDQLERSFRLLGEKVK
jgi:hypothetical protein